MKSCCGIATHVKLTKMSTVFLRKSMKAASSGGLAQRDKPEPVHKLMRSFLRAHQTSSSCDRHCSLAHMRSCTISMPHPRARLASKSYVQLREILKLSKCSKTRLMSHMSHWIGRIWSRKMTLSWCTSFLEGLCMDKQEACQKSYFKGMEQD